METCNLILEFDSFSLDCREFRLLRDGAVISVEPRALEFLIYLAARSCSLVRTDELLRDVWGGVTVSRSAIHYCVVQARRAISDDSRSIIQTVRQRGYRFNTTVTRRSRVELQSALATVGSMTLCDATVVIGVDCSSAPAPVPLNANVRGGSEPRPALRRNRAMAMS